MSSAALRQAWREWCSFADGLHLSEGSSGCAALHGRLFRLCGSHPLLAKHLRATRKRLQAALEPWLGREDGGPADELEQLRRTMSACEPAWRALTGGPGARVTNWDEVERVALAAGLTWPSGPFWTSPLFVRSQRFEPVTALRGCAQVEALDLLATLLGVVRHSHGEPLWTWLSHTPVIARLAQALSAAVVLRDAAAAGVLRGDSLGSLPWLPPLPALLRLCEAVCLGFLRRLNEAAPATAGAAEGNRPAPAGRSPYRRAVPNPLPIEPYFRQLPGSEAFLQAIAAEPLEDVHRLAFADWLDEAGEVGRAAFIRLQCQAERLAVPADALVRRQLDKQIKALFEAHGAPWVAGLPSGRWALSHFRRGMLEYLQFVWVENMAHVRQAAPVGQARDFRVKFGAIDVRGIWQSVFVGGQLRAFLELPWLARLASLDLQVYHGNEGVTEDGMRALAQSPALAGLAHLGLDGSCLGPGCARALLEALRSPTLSSLDLTGNTIGVEGARALAGAAVLSQLRALRLGGNELELEGIEALAASPWLANLTLLDLSWNNLSAQAAEALGNSPSLGNLSSLNLRANRLLNAGAKALARSPLLKHLSSLDLGQNDLTAEGVRALARSPNLAGLAFLDLFSTPIGAAGLRALAESPHVAGLRSLGLYAISLTLEGFRALAGSPSLANLEALDLRHTGLDEEAARVLAASPHLQKLQVLDLDDGNISPRAQAVLRERWPFAWIPEE